jgi:hypothetical protein
MTRTRSVMMSRLVVRVERPGVLRQSGAVDVSGAEVTPRISCDRPRTLDRKGVLRWMTL